MSQIHANTRTTLGLSGLALLIAIAIGLLTARWLMRPLLHLSQAAENIARGDLDQWVNSSSIAEIQTLASAFNSMTGQLKESFAAVRQSEATSRAIVTAIPDLLIRVDRHGTYLDIVGRDRLKGVRSLRQFFPGSKVQDSLPPALAALRMRHIQQALDTQTLQVYEHRIEVDGRLQDEEVRITVLREDEVLVMVRDITDRKQAEEALRQSEERIRSLISNIPGAIYRCLCDQNWTMIVLSDAIEGISGYPAADFIHNQVRTYANLMHPDDRWMVETQVQAALRHRGSFELEYRLVHRDGSIRWVAERGRGLFNADGDPIYIDGAIFDITDRKQSEEQLLREKLFSDTIIDSLPGVFYLYDEQARLVRWNKRYEQVLGYTAAEIAGIHLLETIDIADHDPIVQLIQHVFLQGESDIETHLVTKTGQPISYYMTGRQLIIGNEHYLIGAGIDITERKRAEEALRIAEENYRSIYENALEGIFQSSPDGHFINVNPAMAQIFGYDSPQDMLDSVTNIAEQLYVAPYHRDELKGLLENQGVVKNFEYRAYCKDGGMIWVQIDARAVRDDQNTLLYYEGILQDITDRKHREAELRRQLEELQIEIDQKKREQEVALITQSGYFQELQNAIADVNLDEFWS